MKRILVYTLIAFLAGHVSAQKAAGDSAYIRNDFTTAIQIYEDLLKEGESADIYYNLGNKVVTVEQTKRGIVTTN